VYSKHSGKLISVRETQLSFTGLAAKLNLTSGLYDSLLVEERRLLAGSRPLL
jgi:hypothetical protein